MSPRYQGSSQVALVATIQEKDWQLIRRPCRNVIQEMLFGGNIGTGHCWTSLNHLFFLESQEGHEVLRKNAFPWKWKWEGALCSVALTQLITVGSRRCHSWDCFAFWANHTWWVMLRSYPCLINIDYYMGYRLQIVLITYSIQINVVITNHLHWWHFGPDHWQSSGLYDLQFWPSFQ